MNKKRVLIVDDDCFIRSSLLSLLRSDLVETRTASTMEEAMAISNTESFDLAIVDLRLRGGGGEEGLEIISAIKAREPRTQIVLFTSYGSPEIEQAARMRGAADYWEKTIKIDNLTEKLRALGVEVDHRTWKER